MTDRYHMTDSIDHEQIEIVLKVDLRIDEADGGFEVKQLHRMPGNHKPSVVGFYRSYEEAVCCKDAIRTLLSPITVEGSHINVTEIMKGTSYEDEKKER